MSVLVERRLLAATGQRDPAREEPATAHRAAPAPPHEGLLVELVGLALHANERQGEDAPATKEEVAVGLGFERVVARRPSADDRHPGAHEAHALVQAVGNPFERLLDALGATTGLDGEGQHRLDPLVGVVERLWFPENR